MYPELIVCIERLPIVRAENDINVDRLNNYFSGEEDELFIEESQNEVNFSLKRHVKTKPSDTDRDEEEPLIIFGNRECNEKTFKEEYFIESEIIVQEELNIKDENEGQDQFNANYVYPDMKNLVKQFACKYCYIGLSAEKYKKAHELSCKFRKEKQDLEKSVFECSNCKLCIHHQTVRKTKKISKKRKESRICEESTTTKGERKYCCDKCNYETKQKCYLIRHIRIHDKLKISKYSCNHCSYKTFCKSHLDRHLRSHSEFGLICILCQKSFSRKNKLDSHYVSTHPDRSDKWRSTITNKIYECPKCHYKTVRTERFRAHLATHGTRTDRAQFECNICGCKFLWKCSLRRHLLIHVGQLPFVCTECDKRFNTKSSLDGHIVSRHSENEELINSLTNTVRHCDKCTFRTICNAKLKRHLKTCLYQTT